MKLSSIFGKGKEKIMDCCNIVFEEVQEESSSCCGDSTNTESTTKNWRLLSMLNEYVTELLAQIRREEIKREVWEGSRGPRKLRKWIQAIFDDRNPQSVKGQLACCSTPPCC